MFFKQKTAYMMRSSDWSSDVCSSDLSQVTTTEETSHASRAGRPRTLRIPRPDASKRSTFTRLVGSSVPRAHLDDMTRRRPHRLSGVHDGRCTSRSVGVVSRAWTGLSMVLEIGRAHV